MLGAFSADLAAGDRRIRPSVLLAIFDLVEDTLARGGNA
jgi:hypothetical protein